MHKLLIGLIGITLFACQSAPIKPNPEIQTLKDNLQALEAVITTEPLNRSVYTRAVTSVQEASKKAPVKVYADIAKVVINQAYVLGAWEQCEDTVNLPYEMKGYCWEESTPIFKSIFKAYPDIKNDVSIRVKYLSNDGYFYSRDKIVSRLIAKTKDDLKLIKSKLE
jgi:hypothetical protein